MAILSTGNTFGATDTVTSTKLNNIANAAEFDDPVDDSTLELHTDGKLRIKANGVGTTQIASSTVTKAKIENVANMKVLGNTSGSAAAPQEVSVLDEDDMSSDSATELATQQSIKAYVDAHVPTYIALTGGTVALTQTTNGTYTYAKSDFTGTGLDTTKIHGLYVIARGSCRVNGNFVTVDYTMPDGTIQEVFRTDSLNSPEGHTTTNASTLFLPVGSSQSSIVLTLDSSVTSNNAPSPQLRFEIIAAMQT